MLVGFMEEGHPLFCGQEARSIIPCIVGLLKESKGAEIIYMADNHDPDDREFEMFPPHCIRGSRESELIPELAPYTGRVLPKTRFSAFHGTDLEAVLEELSPEKITVVGVCTDICVMHTVAGLRDRDYRVEVPRDCVASFDPEAHDFALRHMEKVLGAVIV